MLLSRRPLSFSVLPRLVVGVDGPLVVATIEAAKAGLEALNEAMVGDGESVAA